MNGLHVLQQAISQWLVLKLMNTWGIALLLLGTVALAGTTAGYLSSSYDQPAPVRVIAPDGATALTTQGHLCWRAFVPSTPHTCSLLGR